MKQAATAGVLFNMDVKQNQTKQNIIINQNNHSMHILQRHNGPKYLVQHTNNNVMAYEKKKHIIHYYCVYILSLQPVLIFCLLT